MAPHLALHRHHQQQPQQPLQLPLDEKSPGHASAKGQHYADTLDHARRLSLFANQFPAELKTGNVNRSSSSATTGMDWSELLRKFTKHNPHRSLTASAAHTDQVIHALLAQTPVSGTAPPRTALPPLPPVLPPALRPAALTSLAALHANIEASAPTIRDELVSARVVYSFAKYLVGETTDALAVLESLAVELESPPTKPTNGELYDWTLRVLGNAVRGFCIERSEMPLVRARDSYRTAARLYQQAVEAISNGTTAKSHAAGSGPGAREDVSLHRIGETVLSRLCQIDLVASSPHQAYISHLAYIRQSSLYHSSPSSSSSSTLYAAADSLSIHSQLHKLALSTSNFADASWTNRAREHLLRSTTSLPRAGSINRPYLKFLDECIEKWYRNGSRPVEAAELVEILYNALSHTFQSHRLLRYLVRTLTVSSRYEEAAKALRLYVELWDKARETDAKQVAKEMDELRNRAGVASSSSQQQQGVRDDEDDDDDHDVDSERQFIETGAFGVRLLCRYLDDPKEAVRVARRMHEVLKDGKGGSVELEDDARIKGRVEMSLGVAFASLAKKEANPESRPAQHASALAHLELAATLMPESFSAQYHLAYQLFELRQVQRALDRAKVAVSLEKRDRRGWHLLGLILTAVKDYKGALQVLETAIDLGDDDDGDDDNEGGGAQDALAKLEGTSKMTRIRNEEDLHNAWEFPLTATEQLGISLQLRLSKNTVVEYLEGPASALEDQQEMLGWFSTQYVPIAEASRTLPSAPATPATNLERTSTLSKRKSLLGRRVSLRSKRDSSVPVSSAAPLTAPPGLSPPSASPTPYASAAPSRAASRNPSLLDVTSEKPFATTTTTTTTRPDLATNPLATKLLADVWLASAASFRRAGKLEEARGAVSEAERLDADDPDVWSSLASVYIAQGQTKLARQALQRAFSFSVDHLVSVILFSRLYLSPAPLETTTTTTTTAEAKQEAATTRTTLDTQLPFAEALLETLTKRHGWDSPEAWFELSRCYKATDRRDKEKECLVWALQLEETRSLRPVDRAIDRVL